MLPLSGKVKVLNKERKKLYAEVAKMYGKNKSIRVVTKKEKEICARLLREREYSYNFY